MSGYRYWRVRLNRWTGGGSVGRTSYVNIGLMGFSTGGSAQPSTPMTDYNAPTPYVVTQSSSANSPNADGWQAFTGGIYKSWGPSVDGSIQWVQFDAGADYDFTSVSFRCQDNSGTDHYVLDFDVLASSTGAFAGEEVSRLTYTTTGSSGTVFSSAWPAAATFPLDASAGLSSAFVALPMVTAAGRGGAGVAVALPVLGSQSYAHGYNSAAPALPMLAATARAGNVAGVALPALSTQVFAGSNTAVQLPVLSAYAAVNTGTPMGVSVSLPSLLASSWAGMNTSVALPVLGAFSTATFYGWVQTSAVLPAAKVSASGTPGAVGGPSVTLPMFSASGQGGANASASLPSLSTTGGSTAGVVASLTVVLPSLQAGLVSTLQSKAGVAVILPMLRAANRGVVQVMLPVLQVLASGHVVLTYTYEAYAVNLQHKPKINEASVDEVTRYTNYPFDKIVRYLNNYYGVSSTGLYLLGGVTDNGADIPWAWKTAIDDFGSPQKKTIISAYFGGRLGAVATVNLHVGEKGAETYSYVSPRGPDVQNFRRVFGRGIKARYYALGMNGTGAFELDTIDFDTATLTRRI